MPKIALSSVHGSAAGAGMGVAFVTDLCIAAEDARFTPAYAKMGVSPDGGSTVGIATVGTRRALAAISGGRQLLPRSRPTNGVWSPGSSRRPSSRPRREKFAERLAQKSAGRASPAPNRWSIRPRSRQPGSSSTPRKPGIIAAMRTDEFRAAVKKFTSKSK